MPSSSLPLHRCRFFDYTPSPITALAFAPTPLPPPCDPSAKGKARQHDSASSDAQLGVLVLARQNGCVEVWEWVGPEDGGMGNWALEKILPPTLTHPSVSLMVLAIRDEDLMRSRPHRVPKLADLRLYTCGADSGDIVERCLDTGRILQIYSVVAPPVWSMSVSPTHQLLCVATTSPNLQYLSVTSSGLESPPSHLLRSDALPSKTRTVSLAWGPPRCVQIGSDWEWQDTYVVSGNSDSSFRKWELPYPTPDQPGPGRVVMRGRAVVEKVNRNQKKAWTKGTIVWGIAVLPDHTVVTSDSLGSVTFWDGAAMAQRSTHRAHKADAMVLMPGPQGRTVFSAGPDQRVCQFTKVGDRWQLTGTKRIHSHDIRALAVFPAYVPTPESLASSVVVNPDYVPVLASGGWDMSLALTPCASPDVLSSRFKNPLGRAKGLSRMVFEEAYARKMSYLGGGRGTGHIAVARQARLVVGRKDRSVGIWRILDDEQGWEKVLEMDLKLRTTLTTCAISDDGSWLAVSDLFETKLFLLESTQGAQLKPRRIKSFLPTLQQSSHLEHLSLETAGTGASSLAFVPDSSRLIMALAFSGQVVIVQLRSGERAGDVEVETCFSRTEAAPPGRSIVAVRNKKQKTGQKPNGTPKGMANGHAPLHVDDQDAGDSESDGDDSESEDDERTASRGLGKNRPARVACMAVSGDGQWLGVSDLDGKVSLFNLDTLRPHAMLPTLPTSPSAILFVPSHPSLLALLSPSQSLSFYHLEYRRLLPPTTQLAQLNRALRDQFLPIQSAAFEPSRADPKHSRVLIWTADWICSARLDMDQISRSRRGSGSDGSLSLSKSLRRKRAAEAREQLERFTASSPSLSNSPATPGAPASVTGSTTGSPLSMQISMATDGESRRPTSSADDPEFFKFTHDKFRALAAVEWLAEGEMIVVERPMGDFVGDLPPAFWSGSFGRS